MPTKTIAPKPPFNVRHAKFDNVRIRVHVREHRFGELNQDQRKHRCDHEHDDEGGVEDGRSTFGPAFTFPARGAGLHAGRYAEDQCLAHEYDEAAEADGS